MKKVVGDEAVIRWTTNPVPGVGDVLETRTGRQYLVVEVRGRALTTIVVRKDKTGRTVLWPRPVVAMFWNRRK